MTPPHDISGRVVGEYLSTSENATDLIRMMKESYDLLKDHPVNLERIKNGKRPANSIWLWGEGKKPALSPFEELYGIKGAVIGISGGKDSTIVAKLMVECLGKENVMGVLMPNGDQSDINDSYDVVNILDIPYMVVNIKEAMHGIVDRIDYGMRSIHNTDKRIEITEPAYINIAPRIRMTTLYAIAQSMGNGWRVIGTTNKSEEYIGWLTKWGDGAADFEPIIDFTVTELHQLGKNLGLPENLVCKTPIDGLAKGSDEDRFGFTYAELDMYIENGTTGNKETDSKIERMHGYSEHKRVSVPKYKLKI
jgi:NAD+ synthase